MFAWQTYSWKTISPRPCPPLASDLESTTMETSSNAINATDSATASLSARQSKSHGMNMYRSSNLQAFSRTTCSETGWMDHHFTNDTLQRRDPMINPTTVTPTRSPSNLSQRKTRLERGNATRFKEHPKNSTAKNLRHRQVLNLIPPLSLQVNSRPTRRQLVKDFSSEDLQGLPSPQIDSSTRMTCLQSQSMRPSGREKTKEPQQTATSALENPQTSSNLDQKILWWNCGGGLQFKLDYIKYTIKTLCPYILFVSESEILINDDLKVYSIENYNLLTSGTLNLGKSRVCAYVREGVGYKRMTNVESNTVDVIALELENFIIVGIYKPFKQTVPTIDNLDGLLESLRNIGISSKKVLVGGDFNVDWLKESSNKDKLSNWASELNLVQSINEITRQRIVALTDSYRLEESCIDHLFVSDKSMVDWTSIRRAQPSDHHMIQALVPFKRPPEKRKIWIRDWRDYSKKDLECFIKVALENYRFWIDNGPGKLLDRITQLLLVIYEEMVPLRIAKLEPQQPLNAKIEALRKRRDQFLKKYKKTSNPEHAEKASSFTRTLKQVIKKEQNRNLKVKSMGNNTKSFWKLVSKLQGKHRQSIGELVKDGKPINDPFELAEAFADGFLNKLTGLTSSHNPIEFPDLPNSRSQHFTIEEISKAFKQTKSKKSCGIDELPTCVIKDSFDMLAGYYLAIFNDIIDNGIPDIWKIAVITPLHKKGSFEEVCNYRPISNLSSIGKIFERCILHRLERQIQLVGDNQHGFRAKHSTTTALLEVQSALATSMDNGKYTLVYSVDMSAAFDLLRPDMFYSLLKNDLDPGLMRILLDFLHDRRFVVKVLGKESNLRELDRGCVQGSVLGPALFSLYCKDLQNKLKEEAYVTSYADDTYVVLSSPDLASLMTKTKTTMSAHFEFLDSLGMVVNRSKTELMLMNHAKRSTFPPSITTNSGETIAVAKTMKVLGITFDFDLSWRTHMENVVKKSQRMVSGLKVIRHALSEDQFLTVATSQYYGSLYYGLPVWFDSLLQKHKQKMDVLHYKLLRLVIKDWQMLYPREMLDTLGRA